MFRNNPSPPSIPPGIRVYAVGDIHGRRDLLTQLLGTIEDAEAAWPAERTILVFLGDYIDRGPDSSGVIQTLLTGLPDGFEPVFLRGNHEEMLMRNFHSPEYFEIWTANGGIETARSYGVEIDGNMIGSGGDSSAIRAQIEAAVPQAHKDFLNKTLIKAEAGDYLFVHAGVRPNVPLDEQREADCLFIRDEFLRYRGDFGKVVVHGHTPVAEPENLANRIGIDTGAFFTGRLTAVCLEEQSQRFMSVQGPGK